MTPTCRGNWNGFAVSKALEQTTIQFILVNTIMVPMFPILHSIIIMRFKVHNPCLYSSLYGIHRRATCRLSLNNRANEPG